MRAKEAGLEIYICNCKNFQINAYSKHSDLREQCRQSKAPLHTGSESREAVGLQPLTGTVGPIQVGLSSISFSREHTKLSL